LIIDPCILPADLICRTYRQVQQRHHSTSTYLSEAASLCWAAGDVRTTYYETTRGQAGRQGLAIRSCDRGGDGNGMPFLLRPARTTPRSAPWSAAGILQTTQTNAPVILLAAGRLYDEWLCRAELDRRDPRARECGTEGARFCEQDASMQHCCSCYDHCSSVALVTTAGALLLQAGAAFLLHAPWPGQGHVPGDLNRNNLNLIQI
jgi:hypothetical protein